MRRKVELPLSGAACNNKATPSAASEQGKSCRPLLRSGQGFDACSSFSHKSFTLQNLCGSPKIIPQNSLTRLLREPYDSFRLLRRHLPQTHPKKILRLFLGTPRREARMGQDPKKICKAKRFEGIFRAPKKICKAKIFGKRRSKRLKRGVCRQANTRKERLKWGPRKDFCGAKRFVGKGAAGIRAKPRTK